MARKSRTAHLLDCYLNSSSIAEIAEKWGATIDYTRLAVWRLRKAMVKAGEPLPLLGNEKSTPVDYAKLAHVVRKWKQEHYREKLSAPVDSNLLLLPRLGLGDMVEPQVTVREQELTEQIAQLERDLNSLEKK